MTEKQPPLFDDLSQSKPDLTDFLKPNGKKKKSIPTGMKRSEIIDLKKDLSFQSTGSQFLFFNPAITNREIMKVCLY